MATGHPTPKLKGIASKKKKLEQNLEHVTQAMYKQNLELAERNKTLMLLRRIDELVLNSTSGAAEVAQTICDLLISEMVFSLSIIYVADKASQIVLAKGVASLKTSPDTEELIRTNLDKVSLHPSRSGLYAQALRHGHIYLVSNFTTFKPSLEESVNDRIKEATEAKSLFLCPLQSNSGVIGLLVLGLPLDTEEVSDYQKTLVERLTATISIAVENHLLYEELQAAGVRLGQQNKKLKELDQTKDEFISMASHQLRTPLTTIKGYLSMVLEGDVGKVPISEKKMIQQAYDSAEQMVFLIADLLNVSRLQSGKFVIENQPTDMVKMVKSQVNQLNETAQRHGVKLTCTAPDKLPMFSLDDNKVRQVLMNFIDNAIYYTPTGGSIDVRLEVSGKELRFTVTDTGLGVPKAVQHKLFAKFYRADNARKMRPDGTGLGLFMAKKVIAAQGGAIIFTSTEGKGSTFGFSFPLSKVELKTHK